MDSPLDRARQLIRAGKFEQAEAVLRRLVTRPGGAAMAELATVLRLRGNQAGAEQFALMALGRARDGTELHSAGTVLDSLGLYDKAIQAFRRATALNPTDAGSWNGIGLSHVHANRIDEAIEAFERARELSPRNTTILANLAWAWSLGWRVDEALDLMRGVVRNDPTDLEARKLLAFLLAYSDTATPQELFETHVPFGEQYQAMAARVNLPPIPPGTPIEGRAIRVGLLSPDFREHPVARFVESLLVGHDRSRMVLHCYSTSRWQDETTARLRAIADGWTEVWAMGEPDAARTIRADDLDVLVDLCGHTAGGKAGILVLRAARKQVNYLGYPNTTGIATMDARFVDAITDPMGFDAYVTERLVRLSPCFLCYSPSSAARSVPPRGPTTPEQPITFGSFNTLRKLTPRLMTTWCEILRRVPNSRLLLKNSGVNSAGVGRLVLGELARLGIGESRVELLGRMPDETDHYRAYHRLDIALDTSPYNGTTTTCDALWMGVPVVTMLGDRHVSRVSASLLNAAAAADLVARDTAGYVDLAVALAGDAARRNEHHATLRERMERGPLCGAAAFSSEFERTLRTIVES